MAASPSDTPLHETIAQLTAAGLSPDEARLIARRRQRASQALGQDARVAIGLAVAAAVLVKVPALFGLDFDNAEQFYARNLSFFVLPLLAGWFAWQRRLDTGTVVRIGATFLAAMAFINLYPFTAGSDTEVLAVLHLPIALWLAVGVAHAGRHWAEVEGRMDFIRFSGELVIYFALIALGGGVLTGMTLMIFEAIGVNLESFVQSWMLPCGAAGAVMIAAWLVEARQGVMENLAPVLTRVFTPLFALALLAFLGAVVVTGQGVGVEREVLIGFDLLLVVVVCLLLYSISARDPAAPPGTFDYTQMVLVVAALLTDLLALGAISTRINEFGFTPNRTAALGMNLILLVNLAWSAVLLLGFLRGRRPFAALEAWQVRFLPVYAGWAAVVVVVFPLVFRALD
jgi:hypothetical protein